MMINKKSAHFNNGAFLHSILLKLIIYHHQPINIMLRMVLIGFQRRTLLLADNYSIIFAN